MDALARSKPHSKRNLAPLGRNLALRAALQVQLAAFRSASDPQKLQFSLGKPYFLQGGLLCCRTALGLVFCSSWSSLGRLSTPTWRLLGASWSVLGGSWSVLGASWSQLGVSWAALGASWAPLGANLEALGRLLEPTWTLLGASWVQLGRSWAQLGALGRILGSTRSLLGPTWSLSGASWTGPELNLALLDEFWAQLEALLAPLGPKLDLHLNFHNSCQLERSFI